MRRTKARRRRFNRMSRPSFNRLRRAPLDFSHARLFPSARMSLSAVSRAFLRVVLLVFPLIAVAAAPRDAEAGPPPTGQTSEHIQFTVSFDFDYLLYVPRDYAVDTTRQWPLVIFLHGIGERGSNLALVKRHGLPKLIAAGRTFPFLVASPQCPDDTRWNIPALEAFIDELARIKRIDSRRIYVTGLSMGGFAAWSLAQRRPERYAAVVPICGGGDPKFAARLRDLPLWVFHGAKDETVPIADSAKMVAAIRVAGGAPRFTIYPEADHDSWTKTYENEELYVWLLAQGRRE
jgi:predicted peptidase